MIVPQKKTVCIAAPAYNEEMNIERFYRELLETIAPLQDRYDFQVLIVNDGSSDDTEDILERLSRENNERLTVINFSRNFGHTAACMACFQYCNSDAIILMDSDLQDDPAAIGMFLDKWEQGFDAVYAVRTKRKEGPVARFFFKAFYRLFNGVSEVKIPLDAGNFSLMDKKVYSRLQGGNEHRAYIPGLRAMQGGRQTGVDVPRRERGGADSRVGYLGLFRLAKNAIFSFSFLPLKLFNFFGALALLAAFGLTVYALWYRLFTDHAIPAWSSQIIAISFFGGLNMLGIGIIGEYVARIYDLLRERSLFEVRDIVREGKRIVQ